MRNSKSENNPKPHILHYCQKWASLVDVVSDKWYYLCFWVDLSSGSNSCASTIFRGVSFNPRLLNRESVFCKINVCLRNSAFMCCFYTSICAVSISRGNSLSPSISRHYTAQLANFFKGWCCDDLLVAIRAGLKPMQPMQLHWAPHHGVWVSCSYLPDTPCSREFGRNGI